MSAPTRVSPSPSLRVVARFRPVGVDPLEQAGELGSAAKHCQIRIALAAPGDELGEPRLRRRDGIRGSPIHFQHLNVGAAPRECALEPSEGLSAPLGGTTLVGSSGERRKACGV